MVCVVCSVKDGFSSKGKTLYLTVHHTLTLWPTKTPRELHCLHWITYKVTLFVFWVFTRTGSGVRVGFNHTIVRSRRNAVPCFKKKAFRIIFNSSVWYCGKCSSLAKFASMKLMIMKYAMNNDYKRKPGVNEMRWLVARFYKLLHYNDLWSPLIVSPTVAYSLRYCMSAWFSFVRKALPGCRPTALLQHLN